MTEESVVKRKTKDALKRNGEAQFGLGLHLGMETGRRFEFDQQRILLIRMATRRFGTDIGNRLDDRLERIHDQDTLDRVADLILDCYTGGQLLAGVDNASSTSG